MSVTRYGEPYPPMTDRAFDEHACRARYQTWSCTRPDGHEGRHEAGGLRGQMFASWTQGSGRRG